MGSCTIGQKFYHVKNETQRKRGENEFEKFIFIFGFDDNMFCDFLDQATR